MTRKEFLKKYTPRFLAALLLVGLIIYTVYHVLGASAAGLMTTPTREVTDLRIMSGNAYFFRDERVLMTESPGVVNDLVASGVKVSKNQALAEVYTGYGELEREIIQADLDRLNRAIGVLESSKVSAGTPLAQAEEYRAKAGELYLVFREAILEGRWQGLSDTADEMLTLLNRHGILTGRLEDADQLLQSLREERSKLLTGERMTVQSTDASGFFYDRAHVDGYESLYTLERLDTLSPEALDELKNTAPVVNEAATTVGKMVYGYTWHLAVELEGDASVFAVGDSYEINFSGAEGHSLLMTCENLLAGEDGRFVAVLSSNDTPAWLSHDRVQSVEIVVGSSQGYYIPESALVVQDGVEGVYIFRDSTVHFRRIDVIYRGEGYCIAAPRGERGEDYLDLYDILVTAGKKLYDGKVY